jgi:hypothetical protein
MLKAMHKRINTGVFLDIFQKPDKKSDLSGDGE